MPGSLTDNIGKLLSAQADVFDLHGNSDIAEMIRSAELELNEIEYDSWNGGTTGYALVLEVPLQSFVALINGPEQTETILHTAMQRLTRPYPNEYIKEVIISPLPAADGSDRASRSITVPPSFWKPDHFKLFISHVSTYKVLASQIAYFLADYGISAFVAHEDIEPAKEWVEEIIIALSTMDACIALLSNDFPDSPWTDQEMGFAVARGVPIIPVKIDLIPYGFMGRYQALKGVPPLGHELAPRIGEILFHDPRNHEKLAKGVVAALESSERYSQANARSAHLARLPHFSTDLVERLKLALVSNGQVRDSYDAPGRIATIVEKFGK